jgi:predicted AAA+ superfamily ATPase
MPFIRRLITPLLERAAKAFPALVLTGPRRAGKTTVLKHAFPSADVVALDAPDILASVRADPRRFLDERRGVTILDEIQNAPELFAYLKERIDRDPRHRGRWLLTGSQEAPLMQRVTESLAGRVAVLGLRPLSAAESPKVNLLHGGFPEVVLRPRDRSLWFESYLQTYLERDVRAVLNVRDLSTFRRFLTLLATRTGQLLNKADLAAPLGVSIPTIGEWIGVLEVTGQLFVVPPYFENLGKRLVKTPKVFLADSGLACHLLGITTMEDWERSPFKGALFEGWVASEIVKSQLNTGQRRELYFFRDHQGLEVDFLFRRGTETLVVEAKASSTPLPRDAAHVAQLAVRIPGAATALVVYRRGRTRPVTEAILPGVRAVDVADFIGELNTTTSAGAARRRVGRSSPRRRTT